VAQVIERLPSKCKALSSKPSSAKRKTKKKRKEKKSERTALDMVEPTCNISTYKAEAGGS
jgi:hypothetical protein